MQSTNYQNFQNWRKRAKEKLIEAFNGKCGICGYNKCNRNLAFHHLDSSQKEFSIAIQGSVSWAKLVKEARKCVMLCHNCHGEYHSGLIPENIIQNCARFDENYSDWQMSRPEIKTECPVCHTLFRNQKTRKQKFCSIQCNFIAKSKYPSKEQLEIDLRNSNFITLRVANNYRVSFNAVKNWIVKYEIDIELLKQKTI